MATIIRNKFVVDLDDNQAIGVSIPFSVRSVFTQTFDTATQIKSNIINYFLTNKGERILKPNYGGNLRNYLFEQITEESLAILQDRLAKDIATRFPMIELVLFNISPMEDMNLVNVKMVYNVLNLENEVIDIGIETNTAV